MAKYVISVAYLAVCVVPLAAFCMYTSTISVIGGISEKCRQTAPRNSSTSLWDNCMFVGNVVSVVVARKI